jgi:23S rRNA pseudouridine1911/1915/1917 synthase
MSGPSRSIAFVADASDEGRRLDQVLAARVPGLSRRQARVLLDLGGVFVEGRRTKMAGRLVARGQKITAHVGNVLERATKATGQAARARDEERLPPYAVLHEDDDIVVVEKPAGLLTAPTPESDRNNLLALLSRREGASGPRLFVVHRLDLPTSGVLVLAKSPLANRVLSERFRLHQIGREYLAFVRGAFPDKCDSIDTAVGGRPARTFFSIEQRFGERATLLRCRLETGRTHQIRIHCQSVDHPLLGDTDYGTRTPYDPPRLALHATHLSFPHPRTGAALVFDRPLPEDLSSWVRRRLDETRDGETKDG